MLARISTCPETAAVPMVEPDFASMTVRVVLESEIVSWYPSVASATRTRTRLEDPETQVVVQAAMIPPATVPPGTTE